MQLIDTQKKIVDYFDNRLFDFFFSAVVIFAGSSFLNVRICCFSLFRMVASEDSLGFGQLHGQRKQLEDDTLD